MATKQPQDYLRGKKQPVSVRVDIILESEAADRYNAAVQRVEEADSTRSLRPQDAEARSAFIEAQEEHTKAADLLEAATMTFVFKSLGRKAYEELQDAHLPTDEQKKDAKKKGMESLGWNPDTFPQALVAECGYIVIGKDADGKDELLKLTSESVTEIWDDPDWNQAELMDLFMGALGANQSRRVSQLGKDFGRTRS